MCLGTESSILSIVNVFCSAEAATLASKPSSHPKYAVMVKEAFKALDSRKGVTPQAIRNYIRKTYPTVDVHRLTYLVSQALTKKLGSGELVRLENPKLPRAKKYRVQDYYFFFFLNYYLICFVFVF